MEDVTRRQHYCDMCREVTDFESDDGFFCCLQCGSQTQDLIQTDVANDDVFAEEGGGTAFYSQTLHRRTAVKQDPAVKPDFDADEKPRDFSSAPLPDIQTVAKAMRARYLQGLQLMLQKQCEVLVETFKVSPLICGMAASVWLRYVATSGVFNDGWVPMVIANCKDDRAKQAEGSKKKSVKREAIIHFIHRTMRKLVPIYSTLAISSLSCHLAREPVLPTDITDWALEAKLPYLSFFLEMDRYIGTASAACPLKNRTMFRPTLLLGSWQLEAVVGKIAEKTGLHLPSVNFYAIARRCLEELSLPTEILPHACRVYEWLLPAELWISGNNLVGFPTRVVVMSILIITLRILYDVNGYGIWEKSLDGLTDKQGPVEDCGEAESSPGSEFDAGELIRVLEAVHKDIEVKHGHSKDLNSYVQYHNDVICAGMKQNPGVHLNKVINHLGSIYKNNEDDFLTKPENSNFEHQNINGKRSSDDVSTSTSYESSKYLKPDTYRKKCSSHICAVDSKLIKERELDRMRFEMEENWFFYLAPVTKRRSKGYISYRRARAYRMLAYVVHADYYIMLRAFAKLARVDMRLLHLYALELERKLKWIEGNIITCLNVPKEDRSEGGPVERREGELELD